MLRALTEVPIVISHSPLRVRAKPFSSDWYLPYSMVLDRVASFFPQYKLYFYAQPAVTLDESRWATKSVYLRGSTNLRGTDVRKENVSHMNAEFGKSWIEHFTKMIPFNETHTTSYSE